MASANRFEMDGFIARYKSDGTLVWAERIGASTSDNTTRAAAESLAALPDAAIAVTVVFRGQPVFGSGTPGQTTLTGEGAFIAHYASAGEPTWIRQADAASGYGVAALPDGTTFVTGTFSVTARFGAGELHDTTVSSAGSDDGFVAQYASTGSLNWVRRFGGNETEFSTAAAAGRDGTVLITGHFRGPASFDAGSAGSFMLQGQSYDDVYVAAYERDGTLFWAKSAGGPGDESGQSIATASDGSVFVTGQINQTVSSMAAATFGMGEANETTLTEGGITFLAKCKSCMHKQ